MTIIKRFLQTIKYPVRKTDDSEIPEGESYVILDTDRNMYFSYWVTSIIPAFSGTPEHAKSYNRGYGADMHNDLYRLRKQLYRVTTTNKEMGWR